MDFRDAFLKLKTKDKLVLGFASAAGLTVVIMIFFFAFNGLLKGNVEFPESTANQYGKVQSQVRPSYNDLPYFIVFPDTPIGVSVGGEEIGVLQDGTAFRFSEEAYIVATMPESGYNSEDFIRDRFYSLLCGQEMPEPCTYIHKIRQEGYLNTEYLEYEGGILKGPDDVSYYVLSYRQPSVHAIDPMLAVVTTDKTRLRNAMTLLDRMWRTMCEVEIEESEPAVEIVLSGDTETGGGFEGKPADNAKTATDEEAYHGEREIADLEKQRRNMMRRTNGEPAEIYETFVIPQALSEGEVVFYCDYNNVANTPEYAYLLSPSGDKNETPDTFNEDYRGRIIFHVTNPEAGSWKLVVSNDVGLGQYSMYCQEKDLFDLLENPPAGAYGREELPAGDETDDGGEGGT